MKRAAAAAVADLASIAVVVCTLASLACTIQPAAYPPAAYPPPPPGGGGAYAAGGPIEAGCSYNATQIQAGPGAVVQVSCPPGCQSGGLWGTDVYTGDSSICMAGIHAGAISPAGGVVTVRLEPGRPAYRGSDRNGIHSSDYAAYGSSYAVLGPQGGPPPGGGPAYPPPPPGGGYVAAGGGGGGEVIEAGCSFNSTQIHDAPGSSRVVSCPPGCQQTGGLWGTDVYTGDSGICRAAIHAGIISPQGGPVRVFLEPGRPAYRGTTRNGVQSSDYGSYGSSFRLTPP